MNGSSAKVLGITRRFGDRTVLDAVDLTIDPGEIVALLGASGSGKSTLLKVIAGLDRDSTGTVEVPSRISVAFQEARLVPWKSVGHNVKLGLRGSGIRARVERAIAEVGLAGRFDEMPKNLSGGEAQRVSLARALAGDPQLLLLDEPFGALDALTRLNMQGLLIDLWSKHQFSVLLVTHDVSEAISVADRVLVLKGGCFVIDERIRLEEPRRRGNTDFAALQDVLLAELGVHEDAR